MFATGWFCEVDPDAEDTRDGVKLIIRVGGGRGPGTLWAVVFDSVGDEALVGTHIEEEGLNRDTHDSVKLVVRVGGGWDLR